VVGAAVGPADLPRTVLAIKRKRSLSKVVAMVIHAVGLIRLEEDSEGPIRQDAGLLRVQSAPGRR